MHRHCFKALTLNNKECPLCVESNQNIDLPMIKLLMKRQGSMDLDTERQRVMIECKDCHKRSKVQISVLGAKCKYCYSYNVV